MFRVSSAVRVDLAIPIISRSFLVGRRKAPIFGQPMVPGPTGGFDANELYFTAGPDDEAHGLFGKLVFDKE